MSFRTTPPEIQVWYLRSWALFQILSGLICTMIFVLGAIVLKDLTILAYVLLSAGIVYMGWVRLKKPYLRCYPDRIEVIGLFGEVSRYYELSEGAKMTIKGKRLFLEGKKLKFNAWFTNENQYKNMIRYYSGEETLTDELQD